VPAIDEKPKTVSSTGLKRLKNIHANPRVSLVIDDYSDDWTQLGYVLIRREGRPPILRLSLKERQVSI